MCVDMNTNFTTQQSKLEQSRVDSDKLFQSSVDLLNKLSSNISSKIENDEDIVDNTSNVMPSQLHRDENHDPGFQSENFEPNSRNEFQPIGKSNGDRKRENPFKISAQSTEIFEIHVSPFRVDVRPEQIIDYIVDNTDIEASEFCVQRLGENVALLSFISYKISTFKYDIYKAILNDELWYPDQTARPFKNSPPKRIRNNNNRKSDNNFNEYHRNGGFRRNFLPQDTNRYHQQDQRTHNNYRSENIPNNNHREPFNNQLNSYRNFDFVLFLYTKFIGIWRTNLESLLSYSHKHY